jgi:hypothetical protein
VEAEKILQEERIFVSRDLPYTTQLIPLAVLCTLLADGNKIKVTNIKNKIKQWYWCGVFGELYGSANETRYVNDVVGVMDWIIKKPSRRVIITLLSVQSKHTGPREDSARSKGISDSSMPISSRRTYFFGFRV